MEQFSRYRRERPWLANDRYLTLNCSLLRALALRLCTTLYGSPNHASCEYLLHGDGLSSGYTGIGSTDRKDHLFARPLTWRPPDITSLQWDNRLALPILRSNAKLIQRCLHGPYCGQPQVFCKMALLPLRDNFQRPKPLPRLCPHGRHDPKSLRLSPSGGHSRAGDNNNRLLPVLYARDSDFDNRVRRQIAHPWTRNRRRRHCPRRQE
ncbi:hypothetical protein HO173_004202 [Letharia columbiana]|uniref:Uncharacterized protein n=1 Tax=Letharia columbiana TaxID=112416 RepID=A0A8H6L754_9LECA|nr:uncharacterized protein HO173_004202 [Letharia columbiana]KAF6238001.1 hypothetical protein HO173_004202 [Letharia columbiana]